MVPEESLLMDAAELDLSGSGIGSTILAKSGLIELSGVYLRISSVFRTCDNTEKPA